MEKVTLPISNSELLNSVIDEAERWSEGCSLPITGNKCFAMTLGRADQYIRHQRGGQLRQSPQPQNIEFSVRKNSFVCHHHQLSSEAGLNFINLIHISPKYASIENVSVIYGTFDLPLPEYWARCCVVASRVTGRL